MTENKSKKHMSNIVSYFLVKAFFNIQTRDGRVISYMNVAWKVPSGNWIEVMVQLWVVLVWLHVLIYLEEVGMNIWVVFQFFLGVVSEKQQIHRSHIASNKYCSLHMDLCNTWQILQFTTQLDTMITKIQRNWSFWVFSTNWCSTPLFHHSMIPKQGLEALSPTNTMLSPK